MSADLLLVKNLHNGRVVFYWVNKQGKRVSSILHNQTAAEEWWKTYMFSQYEGIERRHSIADRRACSTTRSLIKERKNESDVNPGRRETDGPIKVDIDLYQKKIKETISDIN